MILDGVVGWMLGNGLFRGGKWHFWVEKIDGKEGFSGWKGRVYWMERIGFSGWKGVGFLDERELAFWMKRVGFLDGEECLFLPEGSQAGVELNLVETQDQNQLCRAAQRT